ncbi:hypothetical protein NFI96_026388, partial [Prochilodus magdalenae]
TMKPPSRHRILPARFLPLKRVEPAHKLLQRWSVKEQQNLLNGLKRQRKLNSELDLLLLRKNVPKRTLLEIQNLIKVLKTRVVWRVRQQVRKQKGVERRTKVPIKIWEELAQKMAGIHEKTISSAFSQMLVIAAAEPCSRQHSDKPRSFNTSGPVASHLQTPTSPISTSQSESGVLSSGSPRIMQPGQTCKPHLQSPRKDETLSSPSDKNTKGASSLIQPSSDCSTEDGLDCPQPSSNLVGQASTTPSTPSTPKSSFCQPTSSHTPPVPTASAVSAATVSGSTSSNLVDKQNERQSAQPKSVRMDYTVDFEKIYQFLSNIHTQNHRFTAMECAVLLDLLMSLPEELPLLDCKELNHHVLQVYKRLTTPVNAVSVPRTDLRSESAKPATAGVTKNTATSDQHAKGTNVSLETQNVQTAAGQNAKTGDLTVVSEPGDSAEFAVADGESTSQSSAVKPPKDSGDWAETGLCPLNPFMIPITLLKRKKS